MDPSQAHSKQEGKEALMSKTRYTPLTPDELRERHEYKKKLREASQKWEKALTEDQLDELADVRLRDLNSPRG
jgi:hypothetical protein